jgi:hypothetical protein
MNILNFKGYDDQYAIAAYYEKNYEQLEQDYEEMLSYMQDSSEHISYMRNNDDCFFEWVVEQYYKSLETV